MTDKAESEPRRAAAISGRYYVSRDMGCLVTVDTARPKQISTRVGGVGDRAQRENRHSFVNKVRSDPLREDSRS